MSVKGASFFLLLVSPARLVNHIARSSICTRILERGLYFPPTTHDIVLDVRFCRILAHRKAEKEEERRAREKIRAKLEEDKVFAHNSPM
jgi:hypothetical protein